MCEIYIFNLEVIFLRIGLLFEKFFSKTNDSCKYEHESERAAACASPVVTRLALVDCSQNSHAINTFPGLRPGNRSS